MSKVRIRLYPGNPLEAERGEWNASWCERCVAGKMPDLLHKRRSSGRDVPETQLDHFCMNRKSESELMTVLNFRDCESGCTFASAVGDFPCRRHLQKLGVLR